MVDLVPLPGRFFDLAPAEAAFVGLCAWFGWSSVGAIVTAASWIRRWPPLGLAVGLVATAVPPAGWLVVTHPLNSLGWWFPGTGWTGLLVGLGAAFTLAHLPGQQPGGRRSLAGCLVAVGAFAAVSNLFYETPQPPRKWLALDTHLGRLKSSSLEENWHRAQEIDRQVTHLLAVDSQRPQLLVLPEGVAGFWRPSTQYWLGPPARAAAAKGLAVLAGAVRPAQSGVRPERARNGFLLLQNGSSAWHSGRVPMPGSDWHFGNSSYQASPWQVPIIEVGGRRATVSICYEDALVWTQLQAMAMRPDVHISIASLWFTPDFAIDQIQRRTADGWARLFAVPTLRAVNW